MGKGRQSRSFLLSAGFSNRNKSFKNQHTRRDAVRRSKDASSIIGRNLFAHLHLSSEDSFGLPSDLKPPLLHLRLRIMHISRWPRRGNMDGIFILSPWSSTRFSKTSGRDERGRPLAMRLRVVSTRAVPRSERVAMPDALCYNFIYLSWISRSDTEVSQWKKKLFFPALIDIFENCWNEFIYRACLFWEIWTRSIIHFIIALYKRI